MRTAYLAVTAILLSGTCAHAERITPPGTWLRMMKLAIRDNLGAKDWARISGVYVDRAIRSGNNPVCGKVTATLGSDGGRVTRLFYAEVSVEDAVNVAKMTHFEVALNLNEQARISTRCEKLGLMK